MESKIIVVLGMHRSGTSMIAGLLHKLGVNMGDKLIGKMPSNPLGHFEDEEIVNLNRRILKAAGGSWNNPPKKRSVIRAGRAFEDEIKNLMGRKQKESILSGWKDPRTSLTIELYLPYLINPFFIICHREARAVAQSLKKRNHILPAKGVWLRRVYERQIKLFLREHPALPRLHLNYQNVTSRPCLWVSRIIDYLRIDPARESMHDAESFIIPNQDINLDYRGRDGR